MGETQSGVDRHLETKVLVTSSKKTDHSRALLHRENMTLPYGISGVINPRLSADYEIEVRMLENNPADLERTEIESVVENQHNKLFRQQHHSKALSASGGITTADRGEKNRRLRNRFEGNCFNRGRVTALRTAEARKRSKNHEMPPSIRRTEVGESAKSVEVRSTLRINTVACAKAWSTGLAIVRSYELRRVRCWPK